MSPDGRNIVFVAGTDPRIKSGFGRSPHRSHAQYQEPKRGPSPFWSPDGRSIGFFANGKLKKVAIAGGSPVALADAPSTPSGGSWNRDNVILFAPSRGLSRVSSAGGDVTVVTTDDPASTEDAHRWPHFLPDGRHFVYTEIFGPGNMVEGGVLKPAKPGLIKLDSLDHSEPAVTLFEADSSVSYGSGHLLFARDDILMAQPFDPESRQSTGAPFPLVERIGREGSRYVSASVSENGTLVYARDESLAATQLTWFDRMGRTLDTIGDPARYIHLALSPDERHIAVALETGSPVNRDIWIIDIGRNVRSRLTTDPGTDSAPVWSPDGTRIAFETRRSGKASMRQQSITATGSDELLLDGGDGNQAQWLVRGRTLHLVFAANRSVPTQTQSVGAAVSRKAHTVSDCQRRVQREPE